MQGPHQRGGLEGIGRGRTRYAPAPAAALDGSAVRVRWMSKRSPVRCLHRCALAGMVKALGTLLLRRAIWGIIPERGNLYPS